MDYYNVGAVLGYGSCPVLLPDAANIWIMSREFDSANQTHPGFCSQELLSIRVCDQSEDMKYSGKVLQILFTVFAPSPISAKCVVLF